MLKLLKELKHYKLESILAPLFKMLEAFLELLVPLVVADIIDRGINGGDTAYVFRRALIMTGLAAVGLACSISAQYFSAKAAVGFSTRIRHKLFEHIQKLSYGETDALGTSTMVTRLTSDINQVQTGLNLTLRLLLRSPFVVFGSMIMAFTIDTESALTFAAAIPLLCGVVFSIMLISIPMYRKVQQKLDTVLSKTRENLTGVRVIRAFRLEDAEKKSFDSVNRDQAHMQRVVGRFAALMNPVTYVIINLAIIALLSVGGRQVNSGAITQGNLVALYNYMGQILVELVKMASLIISITKAVACGNRILRVLELPTEEDEHHTAAGAIDGGSEVAVRFEHVSAHYRSACEESVSDISFTVRKGQTFGIIGGTGSGKTTVVNLIPAFYPAASGTVTVLGRNVASAPLESLRAHIGIVPQKAALFKGTIRSNLLFGNGEATDDDLWQALRDTQAEDFVRAKEGQLDAPVEQNGRNFSGGQRQRLTIARALVRKPDILILDDSASALDYMTDSRLRRALRALPYHPTVFIVSQRTASLLTADQILVLEDGQTVGLGTHEELLRCCPVYQEIHATQFRKAEAE